MNEGESEGESVSFGELAGRARAIAGLLAPVSGGERAVLLYNTGSECVAAFFGCLYANIIAVPAEVPRGERNLPRFASIVRDCGARAILTTRTLLEQIKRRIDPAEAAAAARWIFTEEAVTAGLTADAGPDDLAYLQYTSGSTATPKGVMISHANLLANLADIDAGFRHTRESIAVTWLPHFHDMGLVYGLLAPVWGGFRCYVMSPAAFIQRPVRWLNAITKYGATHSGGPNFAYDLCSQKITDEQRAELNLSSWRVAFNGAEPVRAETLQRFSGRFEPCGFRFDAFHPAYGLAEATLKVTARDPERPIQIRDGRVSCGIPAEDTRIDILDGQICVSGPSIAKGYWNRRDDPAFVRGMLHTGDIGFIKEGELYVTGRVKDLIIVRGRNHYPQDIELTAERAHEALRPNAGAAFSIEDAGEEKLAVVQEIERGREADAEDTIRAIRRAIAEVHEVYAHAVVIVRTGTVPKTSSGKIQRQLTKQRFGHGELSVIASSVGLPEIGPVADSLTAMELQAQLEREYGIEVPAAALLGGSAVECGPVIAGTAAGETVVSIEQERLWMVDRLEHGNAAFHVPMAVRFQADPDITRLEAAVREILRRHDALRARFVADANGPAAIIDDHVEVAIGRGPADSTILCAPFDLQRGPLFRMTLDGRVLTVVFHHIIADLWSAAIFARELATLYEGGSLGPVSVRYADFARWQRERLRSTTLDLEFWRKKLEHSPRVAWPEIPRTSGIYEFEISEQLARRVREWSGESRVTPFMVLHAALDVVLHRYTGQHDFVIGVPAAGRPRPELHNVIGFFAYPVLMRSELSGDPTFSELVTRVREVALEAYDHSDVPFAKVVEAVSSGYCSVRAPLTQVLFSLVREPNLPGTSMKAADAPGTPTDFDAFLTLVERAEGSLRGLLAHNLNNEVAAGLAESFIHILERGLGEPQTAISKFELRGGLTTRREQTIAVAATFTGEPVERVLEFWMDELRMPTRIRFAGYRQLFQALLDPNSLFGRNRDGVNVAMLRLADWSSGTPPELTGAIRHAAARTPLIVAICPSGIGYTDAEDALAAELAEIPGVHVLTPDRISAWYPVERVEDPHAHELGHVPYTEPYFVALGTAIARTVAALRRLPHKVIVLDCDQTLWSGVCGEDGPQGIQLDAARLAVQRMAVAQHAAGMLLALASKNNEDDVDEVFARRDDMPLRQEHLVAKRINWQPKPDNLRSLANELRLGLDSLIFIDDNPVECAEVRAAIPQVLTVQLPEESAEIEPVLRHLWPLDHLRTTAEDRTRTAMYRQEAQRREFEQRSPTLGSFLEGLQLRVNIAAPRPDQLARVAQLTQRTNQFNCTSIRRTEAEIADLLRNGTEIRIVEVADRFGDYGLVGVLIFNMAGETLHADTFLLSCRALGRGVEHRMLAALGQIVRERGLGRVEVAFAATRKNKPAFQFLEQVSAGVRQGGEGQRVYSFTATAAAHIRYRPQETHAEPISGPARTAISTDRADWVRIAQSLRTVEQIGAAVALKSGPARAAVPSEYVPPRTPLEQELAQVWTELLHVERVGVQADFFALGGHSLLAVQLLSRVRDRFQVELSLDVVFTGRFTVSALAEAIELYEIQHAGDLTTELLSELENLSDEEIRELLRTDQGGA